MDYRLIAVQIGDLLKWDTSVNQIDRIASSILKVNKESFPIESITSARARTIYDWILSLAKTEMNAEERTIALIRFCTEIAPEQHRGSIAKILSDSGLPYNLVYRDNMEEFAQRAFHAEVARHSQKLFLQGNFFHAVFESCKAFNSAVKQKSHSDKDGESLMMGVWGCDSGVLKITKCQTETDRNIQDGVKFLSAGLMRAVRNPTAHEPALDWSIEKKDCLDILSFISFLYRQLDIAVYFKK